LEESDRGFDVSKKLGNRKGDPLSVSKTLKPMKK